MFRSIVVPLDTSRVAAQALPYAVMIAEACKARITLVSVIEPLLRDFGTSDILGIPSATRRDADERMVAVATAYLESIAMPLRARGMSVTTEIHHGNPAEEIIATAESSEPALIVISTHGRSGLERLRLGSVAMHVMRHAAVPTLIVPPWATTVAVEPAHIQQITVPLDGSAFSETALPIAQWLAGAFVVPLTLVRALPPVIYPTAYDAGSIPPVEEQITESRKDAEAYLAAAAGRLTPMVPRTEVLPNQTSAPDKIINRYLAEQPLGMVVMASHGRSGVARWVLGSTAEGVIAGAACPILVARAKAAASPATEPAINATVTAPAIAVNRHTGRRSALLTSIARLGKGPIMQDQVLPLRVLIVYYSRFGAIKLLAQEVAAGAGGVPGITTEFLEVEDLPVAALRSGETEAQMQMRRATVVGKLGAADALIVGAPSYFGSMASPVKRLFEDCATADAPPSTDRSRPWRHYLFHDKAGAAFATSATPHGGNEQTLQSILTMMMHLGMLVVTPGQQMPILENDAAPYGATAITGADGNRIPTEVELAGAHNLGRRVAEVATWLATGRLAWEKTHGAIGEQSASVARGHEARTAR